MDDLRLHRLSERLSALLRSSLRQIAVAEGLKLAQLEALVFLGMANRYSDTPIALAEYFGVTKGTMSQTVKALEGRGLIEKVPDDNDGRVLHCRPTPLGEAIISLAYPATCFRGESSSPVDESGALADALEAFLRKLQRANGLRSFGQCRSCTHFQRRSRGGRCGLTGESLSKSECSKICREHDAADAL